jgi:hypothetical protein
VLALPSNFFPKIIDNCAGTSFVLGKFLMRREIQHIVTCAGVLKNSSNSLLPDLTASTTPTFSFGPARQLKTGSVMDILGTSTSFTHGTSVVGNGTILNRTIKDRSGVQLEVAVPIIQTGLQKIPDPHDKGCGSAPRSVSIFSLQCGSGSHFSLKCGSGSSSK